MTSGLPLELAVPLHTRLRTALVDQIVGGALPPGSRVPSERDLCRHYRVSRTTTRRALADLVHEGWLYTVVGKGTFVARDRLEQELRPFTGFSDDLRRRGIAAGARVLAAERLGAPEGPARHLALPPGAPVFRLRRLRLADGLPVAVQATYLPADRCPDLLRFDFADRSLYAVLRGDYGLRLLRGHTTIKAGLATRDERDLLGLRPPAPVLRTFQTTHLDDGAPIEYCESVFHGERYELTSTDWEDRVAAPSPR
jgi:GntR family transcriptional regulator